MRDVTVAFVSYNWLVLEFLFKVARFDRPLSSGNTVKKSYQGANSLS